jgi:hypothetical protein
MAARCDAELEASGSRLGPIAGPCCSVLCFENLEHHSESVETGASPASALRGFGNTMTQNRLLAERPVYHTDFKGSIEAWLQRPGVQAVYLPALDTRAYLVPLSDGGKLHVYEQYLDQENFACDCCRIVGKDCPACTLSHLGHTQHSRSHRSPTSCCRLAVPPRQHQELALHRAGRGALGAESGQ